MTPNFITGLAMPGTAALLSPEALWLDDLPAHRRASGYATITLGPCRQAQGPVIERLRDGRITIDAGGRILTGHSVTPRPETRSLWTRISRYIS